MSVPLISDFNLRFMLPANDFFTLQRQILELEDEVDDLGQLLHEGLVVVQLLRQVESEINYNVEILNTLAPMLNHLMNAHLPREFFVTRESFFNEGEFMHPLVIFCRVNFYLVKFSRALMFYCTHTPSLIFQEAKVTREFCVCGSTLA